MLLWTGRRLTGTRGAAAPALSPPALPPKSVRPGNGTSGEGASLSTWGGDAEGQVMRSSTSRWSGILGKRQSPVSVDTCRVGCLVHFTCSVYAGRGAGDLHDLTAPRGSNGGTGRFVQPWKWERSAQTAACGEVVGEGWEGASTRPRPSGGGGRSLPAGST